VAEIADLEVSTISAVLKSLPVSPPIFPVFSPPPLVARVMLGAVVAVAGDVDAPPLAARFRLGALGVVAVVDVVSASPSEALDFFALVPFRF
jgi:hypothetical protein